MKTLGIREMRASYDVLQKALAQEGEVLLTHHGKPFARVLPLVGDRAVSFAPCRRGSAFLRGALPVLP